MSSQLLLLLKFSLLALLYLFLLRVVRAVWAELSPPAPAEPLPVSGMSTAGGPLPATTEAPGRSRGIPKSSPPTGAVAAVGVGDRGAAGVDTGPAELVVVAPPALVGRSVVVRDDGVLVGRGPGCDLVVEDSYVSQHHVRITSAGDNHWWVEDLGSTNGTFVGGERVVAPRRVGRGEPVSIGGVVVELR